MSYVLVCATVPYAAWHKLRGKKKLNKWHPISMRLTICMHRHTQTHNAASTKSNWEITTSNCATQDYTIVSNAPHSFLSHAPQSRSSVFLQCVRNSNQKFEREREKSGKMKWVKCYSTRRQHSKWRMYEMCTLELVQVQLALLFSLYFSLSLSFFFYAASVFASAVAPSLQCCDSMHFTRAPK